MFGTGKYKKIKKEYLFFLGGSFSSFFISFFLGLVSFFLSSFKAVN